VWGLNGQRLFAAFDFRIDVGTQGFVFVNRTRSANLA
jgi:hypothetical protein